MLWGCFLTFSLIRLMERKNVMVVPGMAARVVIPDQR